MTKPQTKDKENATEDDFSSPFSPENNVTQLQFLYKILSMPAYSVLEEFIERSKANPKKSTTSCMAEFRSRHKNIMGIILFIDTCFRIYAILIILRVILR